MVQIGNNILCSRPPSENVIFFNFLLCEFNYKRSCKNNMTGVILRWKNDHQEKINNIVRLQEIYFQSFHRRSISRTMYFEEVNAIFLLVTNYSDWKNFRIKKRKEIKNRWTQELKKKNEWSSRSRTKSPSCWNQDNSRKRNIQKKNLKKRRIYTFIKDYRPLERSGVKKENVKDQWWK